VAEMKAVILSTAPNACIVDISHEIEKFNISMGAFILASAAPFFPNGTVHVAVVDPTVGSKRHPIIVETKRSFLVGPDNGLLMLAAQREGIQNVYRIVNKRYMRMTVSKTFHGRDIFAPVAAYLLKGEKPQVFGPKITEYTIPKFAKAHVKGMMISGRILHVDDFGNIVTNAYAKDVEKAGFKESEKLLVEFNGEKVVMRFCSAYSEVPEKTPLAIIGSHDFLEISINKGNASEKFNVKPGIPIRILPAEP
jgi:S-adenosylmethionine hydrolase